MGPLPPSLLSVTVGLLAVLLSRRPARRLFGAGPAFTLWLLPLLLGLLPWLPWPPTVHATRAGTEPLPVAQAFIVQAVDTVATATHGWLWLWLGGCACLLLRLGVHFHRLHRDGKTLPAAMAMALQLDLPDLDVRRVRLHPAGPAVFWSPRSRLLLPADFLQRFDARARAHVLLHEATHMRRCDPLWSLLAELALALLWFHPLAWLALPAFRLDQELACDEAVLRKAPGADAAYARTLLHSAGAEAQPTLISWFAESQLKERLAMIHANHRNHPRRRIGYVALATLLAGAMFATHAAMPAASAIDTAGQSQAANPHAENNGVMPPTVIPASRAQNPPMYPADAIKNKEQGTVALLVLVGPDGTPREIKADPGNTTAPQELVDAAITAAGKWHFNPSLKDGKPLQDWARISVRFSLKDL
jgi:TonB family protein